MTIHTVAERGFTAGADAYDKGRPGYPDEAMRYVIEALNIGPKSVVADIGAGTGKFTRGLLPTQAKIIAVEPLEAMRSKLTQALPGVEAVDASAESLPFEDASVDVITVAQAFHWFDPEKSLAEFHRVLKRRGRLGLLWNVRDERIPWMNDLEKIIAEHETITPHHDLTRFNYFVRGQFSEPEHHEFVNAQDLDEDGMVTRIASISFIATLAEPERQKVFEQVRTLLRTHPDTRDLKTYRFVYRLHVYTSRVE